MKIKRDSDIIFKKNLPKEIDVSKINYKRIGKIKGYCSSRGDHNKEIKLVR